MFDHDCPVADLLRNASEADYGDLMLLREAATEERYSTRGADMDHFIADRMLALIDLVGGLRYGSRWKPQTMVFINTPTKLT